MSHIFPLCEAESIWIVFVIYFFADDKTKAPQAKPSGKRRSAFMDLSDGPDSDDCGPLQPQQRPRLEASPPQVPEQTFQHPPTPRFSATDTDAPSPSFDEPTPPASPFQHPPTPGFSATDTERPSTPMFQHPPTPHLSSVSDAPRPLTPEPITIKDLEAKSDEVLDALKELPSEIRPPSTSNPRDVHRTADEILKILAKPDVNKLLCQGARKSAV